ncbi:MAG: phosphotransferase [Lachnospiraceae bacterium]|jgi:Ser/Thr protein kinase RdoA (MazF antagonist)|nr:phosphotransferase [Lachnospiraceae bacterium]
MAYKNEKMDTDYANILSRFGICEPLNIAQIYESAWNIGDNYVLKANKNHVELDKSIRLTHLLLSEAVPVIEYINTTDGEPYVFSDNKYWCLMKRIKGTVFDPFIGEPKQNGIILGKAVAKLHIALINIENEADAHEADFHNELTSWIIPELEKGGTSFVNGVIDSLHTFFERDYKALPRQLIHRDIHTSNLLFENGVLSGYLDFDMSQRNVRIWDVVYLGCSQLVENYQDEARLKIWREIFHGILQGYNELSPLNENEIVAIPAMFIFDEVLFASFYTKTGQPETAKSCMEMANWLYENIYSIVKDLMNNE